MSEKFGEPYWDFVQMKYRNRYNFTSLLPLLSRQMNWIKRYVQREVRVLDIGSGFGYFLKLCDKSNWETYGMDISNHAINIARRNTRAQLYQHNIEDSTPSSFEDDYFDLITMFEVIEHLTDPHIALNEVHRLLRNDGKFVITTPNLYAIERVILKILLKEHKWHGFFDETHVNFFTPFALKILVESNGFKALDLKTPFHPLSSGLNFIFERTLLGGDIWLMAEKA